MKRTILMMASTMALMVLLVGGVALAVTNIDCGQLSECPGTSGDDNITGNQFANFIDAKAGNDTVQGLGSNDTVHGRGGADVITGDGTNDPTTDGSDTLFGEGRGDTLTGETGANAYFGGPGPDTIHADQSRPVDVENISAGDGNDHIFVGDGARDVVDCGSGSDVVESFDVGVDQFAGNCDDQN
jgi:Ca2+-binding RTX toxin-like protein